MSCASFFPLFFLLSSKNVRKEQKKMSATKQYIQAETSSRIDACFGGVVVEHESHKFQYYQDRNKRWPFTCSEKGCALLFFVWSWAFKIFSISNLFSSSSSLFLSTERSTQNQRRRRLCVRLVGGETRNARPAGASLFSSSALSFILRRKKLVLFPHVVWCGWS